MLLNEKLISRLEPPVKKPVDVVLDTDTYNEIDDQFALAYALLSPEINLQAVYAAPYLNDRSVSPEDGMLKSYNEIKNIIKLSGVTDGLPEVYEGSRQFMANPREPVTSPAMENLIARALERPDNDPLYVAVIGCPVNIASAIIARPEIINKIVVVWLGGNARYWQNTAEFNLMQDKHSSRVLLNSGVPLVVIPCQGVVTHLFTTIHELEYYLKDAGGLGQYLCEIFHEYTLGHSDVEAVRSKVIWDIVTIAWIKNSKWVATNICHSPILNDNLTYSFDDSRHFIREAVSLRRDAIFADLYKTLGSRRLEK